MKNERNKVLKIAMLSAGVTQKDAAEEMGINAHVFKNKINGRVVHGYKAYFKPCEKKWLADKFNVDVNEIE